MPRGEHLVQAMAHAFRDLAGQRGHVSHVRVRERDHQRMHGPFHAGDHGQGLTEIDLRAARRPFQLAGPLGLAAVALAPALDPSPHRRITALEAAFLHEPLVHAPGGVPLFARHAPVGLEPFVDQRRVRVDLGAAAPVRGRFRRHVVHVGVFRDSGAVHVRPPRDLRPGHSLTVQSPDILLFGHRYRHRPFLPERRRLQPADSFLGHISGIYRHGGPVPVLVWAVIWCSSCWKPAAHTAEK